MMCLKKNLEYVENFAAIRHLANSSFKRLPVKDVRSQRLVVQCGQGGLSQFGHFANKRRVCQFFADIVYERLLNKLPLCI